MYIAPGQGQIAPRGQSFDVNRNVLSLHSFVASCKTPFLPSPSPFVFLLPLHSPLSPVSLPHVMSPSPFLPPDYMWAIEKQNLYKDMNMHRSKDWN